MRRIMILVLLLALAATVAAQDNFEPVEVLTVEVLAEYPHDTTSFTQGLLLHTDGLLYESGGQYGQSTLRAVERETGEVLRRFDLPEQFFAEGLALVDNRLIQLTWRENTAIVYEVEAGAEDDTFEPLGTFQYNGQGWGLCYDGDVLYHSNGSNAITVRDPETFEQVGSYRVTLYGAFVDQLNELECVDDDIYANVWNSDTILRFDSTTGVVNAVIDGAGLLTPEERAVAGSGGVLNGIAYDPENDVFLITGKYWPTMFEVNFIPAG
ncbi:MAG: glutaminyl-peptide cyclotransferase [Chloroflexota bacterium]